MAEFPTQSIQDYVIRTICTIAVGVNTDLKPLLVGSPNAGELTTHIYDKQNCHVASCACKFGAHGVEACWSSAGRKPQGAMGLSRQVGYCDLAGFARLFADWKTFLNDTVEKTPIHERPCEQCSYTGLASIASPTPCSCPRGVGWQKILWPRGAEEDTQCKE